MAKVKRLEDCLQEAADLIKSGEVVVIPTDTVFGLACDACNPKAVAKIYALKNRPASKSLQAIFPSTSSLKSFGLSLPAPLGFLAEKFLPGGLCPIALAEAGCPLATVRREGGVLSQAVRVPALPALLKLASLAGPLAASSANLSSLPTAKTAVEAESAFGSQIPLCTFSSAPMGGAASTVVRAREGAPFGMEILREGAVTAQALYRALSDR
ncbi:MAG: L-threonylcarbamoyladenylate synthase [Aeriscardovia sp.]|nr:L-threonylcarbamoyladenylate synthase [Aeriscardovia sp.]